MLKRYWFVLTPDFCFGPLNLGITANSVEDAMEMAEKAAARRLLRPGIIDQMKRARVVEDIDIRLLDPDHVIPNLGVVVREGIWWPHLNS